MKVLLLFRDKKRSCMSVWNWSQKFEAGQIYKRKRVLSILSGLNTITNLVILK